MRPRPPHLALSIVLLVSSPFAMAQDGAGPGTAPRGGLPQGVTREQMWWAPTAEDWKKPCLITWQRTYEDALAVARETGKPILVCINMDGEIASEHYAGVRYRQPDIARLYEPYVCVIASVYRHNPRDYDEEGRRILCPRFGSVTCGEHIAIEPGLFDKFMDGRRIAPRHIGVELEKPGAEMYDVFYAWDTDTIFNSLREGIANRPPPIPIVRGDRALADRVASRDIADRTAVENAYIAGTREQRRALLEAAISHRDLDQLEILRLALFGLDLELARLARRELAQSASESAIDLIVEALRVPMEASERDGLIAALVRIGEASPRARTLAAVYQGLAGRSTAVDMEGWSAALANGDPSAPPGGAYVLESRIESQTRASKSRPDDAAARIDLAEAYLELAASPETSPKHARLMFQDARNEALEAEKLGASGWRVNSALAVAAYRLGAEDEARARAEAAMQSGIPAEVDGANAVLVLSLFAQARQRAIVKAVREKAQWPAQWLTDVNAAYSVLARHPLGTDLNAAAHHDFLRWLGAVGPAARVLDEGLARFPESWILHDRMRSRILAEKGADGLEPAYDAMLAAEGAAPNLEWFAGYTSLVAAEFHRRAGNVEKALGAYERAIAHYDRAIDLSPMSRESSDHYVALALAGRARISLERADHERALSELLASFERKPDAAASLDGLNISAVDTAKMLRAKLVELKREDLVKVLQTALDGLDPALLELPAYEREGPRGTSSDARPPDRARPPRDR